MHKEILVIDDNPDIRSLVSSILKDQNFNVEIHEYEGADHGFNCEDRKSYNAEASKSALERSVAFIDNHDD